MATSTFTIPNGLRSANQQTATPGVSVPVTAQAIKITLTSPDWSNAALAGTRVLWGVALSNDGGVTWGPGTCDNAQTNPIGGASLSVPAWIYETSTVGQFSKGGGLPFVAFSGAQIAQADAQVRLFCWPEADIHLGATITLTS